MVGRGISLLFIFLWHILISCFFTCSGLLIYALSDLYPVFLLSTVIGVLKLVRKTKDARLEKLHLLHSSPAHYEVLLPYGLGA